MMARCRFCESEFDDSLTWVGAKRHSGLPRQFCSLKCKNKKNNTPERRRRYFRKSLYSLSEEDYERFLSLQNGVCAICGKAQSSRKTQHLTVDHDHDTGRVRGLLCSGCNSAIGLLGDDIELLRRAILYLETY